jgi:hypothetical protein
MSNHGTNKLNHALAKVRTEVRLAGSRMDVVEVLAATPGAGTPPNSTRLVGTLVPRVAGAASPTYTIIAAPLQIFVDYPVTTAGLHGCVRLIRTPSAVTVLSQTHACNLALI